MASLIPTAELKGRIRKSSWWRVVRGFTVNDRTVGDKHTFKKGTLLTAGQIFHMKTPQGEDVAVIDFKETGAFPIRYFHLKVEEFILYAVEEDDRDKPLVAPSSVDLVYDNGVVRPSLPDGYGDW